MIFSKKNLWLLPNKVCIIRGNAVALNLMFENKKDHKIFLQMWDKYLGNMTEVIQYHLSPTDWTILFKTKTKEEIKLAYQTQRSKSKKAKLAYTLEEPKRMLSEHIRIFLSQFVRRSNQNHGRKGTLVLESFQKYILHSSADYEKIFHFISNQHRLLKQNNPRYQADEKNYDIQKEISDNDLLRVGNKFYYGAYRPGEGYLKCMRKMLPDDPVLRNFLNHTQKIKLTQNSS